MPCAEKKSLKPLQLWIELGVLALLAGCGASYSQQDLHIYPAGLPWYSKTTVIEKPSPKCDLPIPNHPSVDTWVRRFSEKYHNSFQTQLDRARFYAAPSQEIFVRKGLPKDLVYVALIESGFSPAARSHAKAVGIWQIVPETGSRFGLEQNVWVDERRHPVKSAKVAADYLSLLYNQFGSWSLALAAYNAGENAVQSALDESGLNTFWDLLEKGYLPAETRDYVPKVFAAVQIVRNPDLYCFRLDPEHLIALHETVFVPGGLKLSWVGKQIGVSEDLLQRSNPELYRSVTPPGPSKYELRLPLGTGDSLLAALARHPQGEEKPSGKAPAMPKRSALTSYKVKSGQKYVRYLVRQGDTLSSVADRFHVPIKTLCSQNKMNPDGILAAGHVLTICTSQPYSSQSAKRRVD